MLRRFLYHMLAVLVLGSLALGACGSPAEEKQTDTRPEETKKLSEDRRELSAWLIWENEHAAEPNDLLAVQKIEEITNVHINWQTVGNKEAREKFSLMLASGKMPDLVRSANIYYPGGMEKGVQDGVFLEITDLAPKYMPRYMALIAENERLQKDVYTDDHRLVGTWTLASYFGEIKGEQVWAGPCIRGDWLEEQELDLPVTIADWEKVLSTIHAHYPECDAPLMTGQYGHDRVGDFISAYGVLYDFFTPDGKTVLYGPMEEGYRQWVELFRDWYRRGLIDPNFITNDASITSPNDYMGTGRGASGCTIWGYTDVALRSMGYNDNPDFRLVATTYPVLHEGDTPQAAASMSELVKEGIAISAKTADPELTLRYLDYWYTEECMMLDSLGIEGESYHVNNDGSYRIDDRLWAQVKEGTAATIYDAIEEFTLGTSDFGLYNWGMFDPMYEGDPCLAAYDAWNQSQFDLMLPPCMTMTDEENSEFYARYTNIETLVHENTVKFITGERSMEEWDDFQKQLIDYGIEKCIACKQAALDRYNLR